MTKKEAGWRFDKYLKKLLPAAGSGFLYKMLRKKNITLNEKKAAGNEVVAAGDTVQLFFSEETFFKFSGREPERSEHVQTESGAQESCLQYRAAFRRLKNISVIYEDDNILVLNKPAGVLSQKADRADISLNEWMIGYLLERNEITEAELALFRPSVCNRLDRNTSGLVLCGKSVRSSQYLSELLRNRSLHKYYMTYVKGQIGQEITLDGYLKKEEEKNRSEIIPEAVYQRMISEKPEIGKEYKRIETVIRPLFYLRERDCTKLEVLLVTGKSHQIRAHLASLGHPVLGDRKYGWKPEKREDMAFEYQLLHAYRVEFPDTEGEFAYLSGKSLTAPLPESWKLE